MPVNEGFVPKIQVFEPHRASLPPLIPYLKEFWSRRAFAQELARFSDKAEYLDSRLGKVWLVLNPLLLGFVYYLVVTIIRPGGTEPGLTRLDHLLIGLFTFYFAQNCVTAGAGSITSGGRLILNQAFPRALLPFSSSIQAFQQFLPTIPVYIFVLVVGKFILICTGLTGFGLALVFATLNVYFRDTNKLLTYITRIWMYLSPVLWLPNSLRGNMKVLLYINPLGPVLTATSRVWVSGESLDRLSIFGSIFWAIASITIGGYFFISRERDFAIRI
jgi:teichoic acid transport system permease protein